MTVLENSHNGKHYQTIMTKWNHMCEAYAKSATDSVMSEDNAFAIEIIDFLLDSIISTNAKPDVIAQELYDFNMEFYYGPKGPEGDSYHYLEFDMVSVYNILLVKNPDKATTKQIATIVKKLELARKRFK